MTKTLLAKTCSEKFHNWLYNVCEITANKLKAPHDIYPYVDLTDAKLAFIDGMSELEYSKYVTIL